MNIQRAVKTMDPTKGIYRKLHPYLEFIVTDDGSGCFNIKDTITGSMGMSPVNKKKPAYWNIQVSDILADDWEIVK